MNKVELEDKFNWWITCIPDKIYFLKDYFQKVNIDLDYSLNSLDELENYVVNTFSIQDLLTNYTDLYDAVASYLGCVYKININISKWYIELDDTKYAYFNKPELIVEKLTRFQPHSYIDVAIDRKRLNIWSSVIKKHIFYIKENVKK